MRCPDGGACREWRGSSICYFANMISDLFSMLNVECIMAPLTEHIRGQRMAPSRCWRDSPASTDLAPL